MNRDQVIDLLSKAKVATPGPWEHGLRNYDRCFVVHKKGLTLPWSEKNMHYIASANPEAITRLAESYLDAIEILRWYSDDDSHGCGEFIWKKTAYEADAGKRAREFLRKIGET